MKLFMKEHSYFIDLRPVSKLQVPVVCDRNQVLVSEPETKVQFIFQASNFSHFFHFLALSILVRILTPWTCGACTFSRHSGSWRFFVQRYFSVLDIPAQACYISQQEESLISVSNSGFKSLRMHTQGCQGCQKIRHLVRNSKILIASQN